jgi:hypothetical protein
VQLPAAGLTHPPALGHTQRHDVVPRAGHTALLCEELAGAALKRGDLRVYVNTMRCKRSPSAACGYVCVRACVCSRGTGMRRHA